MVEARELDLRFRYAKVGVHLTLAGCCAELVVASFERRRPDGPYLMWDALSMYRALSLTAQRHQAWNWVNSSYPSWEKLVSAGYGYLSRGAQVGEHDHDRDLERNLANTSLSTPLFLAVMARFLSAVRHSGGIIDEAVRPAIRMVFRHVCCFIAAHRIARLCIGTPMQWSGDSRPPHSARMRAACFCLTAAGAELIAWMRFQTR